MVELVGLHERVDHDGVRGRGGGHARRLHPVERLERCLRVAHARVRGADRVVAHGVREDARVEHAVEPRLCAHRVSCARVRRDDRREGDQVRLQPGLDECLEDRLSIERTLRLGVRREHRIVRDEIWLGDGAVGCRMLFEGSQDSPRAVRIGRVRVRSEHRVECDSIREHLNKR